MIEKFRGGDEVECINLCTSTADVGGRTSKPQFIQRYLDNRRIGFTGVVINIMFFDWYTIESESGVCSIFHLSELKYWVKHNKEVNKEVEEWLQQR